MFTFSIVKKIGEGKYLNEDHFIIEIIRRQRALNTYHAKTKNNKSKNKGSRNNEKLPPS